jgi:hypothetical protein
MGKEPWLSFAVTGWTLTAPSLVIVPVEVSLSKNYSFNYGLVDTYNPLNASAFVAWDDDFENFQRLELMGFLKARGFKLPPLIETNCQLGKNVDIKENCWIQPNCVIADNVSVGMNVFLGMNSRVGLKTVIGNNTWIGQNVIVGSNVKISSHVSLASRMLISDNISIGKQVRIDTSREIFESWEDFTFSMCLGKINGSIINYR